jgi:alpha-beta hydrolase superfamily lysophospholipase
MTTLAYRHARPRRLVATAALLMIAAAGGCAAPKDTSFDPDAEPVLYYVSENPQTTREEHVFTGHEGAQLAYVAHRGEPTRTGIVYLHGIESHAGWFDEAADMLAAQGIDVLCLDRRGSGINRENRGYASGHIDQFETLYADIRAFLDQVRPDYDRLFLVGLSWGGKLGLGYALSDPSDLDGLILITPGVRSKVDVRLSEKLRILGASVMSRQEYVEIPIEPEMFTSTPYFLEKINADPLKLHYATAQFLLESERLEKTINRDMDGNTLPLLVFLAGHDAIIDNPAVTTLIGRAGVPAPEILIYEDQTHSIQFDAPGRLVDDMVAWIAEH